MNSAKALIPSASRSNGIFRFSINSVSSLTAVIVSLSKPKPGPITTPVDFSKKTRLDDVVEHIEKMCAGGTDCALPMLNAIQTKTKVDTFVILTDNETYLGSVHPAQALLQYRDKVNPGAKLVVLAMTATEFSIADPSDSGMLDVVGLDSSVPSIIRDFSVGMA